MPLPPRVRIGIYIDYALRIPSFQNAFAAFKQELFSDKQNEMDTDVEGEAGVVSFYWREQLKVPEVEDFYIKKIADKDDMELKNSDFKEYFYNEEHWKKFMEDYSFNLYGDADTPCNKDIQLLNITQQYLFDVILIDEFYVTRKKSNTFYFLSKIRVTPQAVLFLAPGQKVDEKTYYGVWNPKANSEQVNKEGFGDFENWLKGLEYDWKKENFKEDA